MTGSWDSVLYLLNGRGGGQSEHERGREGGKDGPFSQHTHALVCLHYGYVSEPWLREYALNSAHFMCTSIHQHAVEVADQKRSALSAHTHTYLGNSAHTQPV